MVGGIVWALAQGHSIQDAVRYGIAAGSAAVMTPGTELCRRDDVFNIYKRIAIVD
jgi:6-phosphofructokinase 2